MCGRFSFAYDNWDDVMTLFNIDVVTGHMPQRFNVAPSQSIPAIVSDGKARRFGRLKWGLQPAKWDGGGPKPINTRLDTLQRNPVLHELVERKRCIVPVSGVFEWQKNSKQPMHIRVKSRPLFGLAGIYDTWVSPNGPVSTCSILTCAPNQMMARIHDRMPVILAPSDYRFYLDRTVTPLEELMPLFQPYPADDMYAYVVSSAVGNVRNDGPECVEPVSSSTM